MEVQRKPASIKKRKRKAARGISFASLSPSQSELEERLRTVCLAICAGGVVAYGLARLKFALVPLVLSLSLKYILQPMIDALTRKGRYLKRDEYSSGQPFAARSLRSWLLLIRRKCFNISLPHPLAVMVALMVALAFLATLAAVVAESVRDLTTRADEYAAQVQIFIVHALRWLDATGLDERWRKPQTLEKLADKLDLSSFVTTTVLSLGEGLLSLLSTTMLVVLFTLYLLLMPTSGSHQHEKNTTGDTTDDLDDDASMTDDLFSLDDDYIDEQVDDNFSDTSSDDNHIKSSRNQSYHEDKDDQDLERARLVTRRRYQQQAPAQHTIQKVTAKVIGRNQRAHNLFSRRVDHQINLYIKGKLALSLLVGLLTSVVLAACRVDLWLAFGVLAFCANFVPNIGAVVAVVLPMPVVLIDPNASAFTAILALVSLVLLHALIGNIVEPLLFGHSMKLHPVTILFSLTIWGFIWGIWGTVLAVPITAVLRIYLRAIDHPLARAIADILDGRPAL